MSDDAREGRAGGGVAASEPVSSPPFRLGLIGGDIEGLLTFNQIFLIKLRLPSVSF